MVGNRKKGEGDMRKCLNNIISILSILTVLFWSDSLYSADDNTLIVDQDGNVGVGVDSGGALDYKLTVDDTIYSSKALSPNNGSETTAEREDTKLLFYDFSATNWAGLGVDTGGDIWIRTGTGAEHFVYINANGAVSVPRFIIEPRDHDPDSPKDGEIWMLKD